MSFKIVFMGTPEFSVPILERLHNSEFKIIQTYTNPPEKKFRGKKINKTPIHQISTSLGIDVRHPISLNTKDELNFFKKLKPDIVIVAAYGKIIPKEFLNIKDLIFLNIHTSLLPKWRGAAPIQRSIMNMDKVTGISFMKVEDKLDSGPIMQQLKIEINKDTTYDYLRKELSKLASENILNCIKKIKNGEAKFIEQNHKIASYAKKILKTESKIDWKDSSEKIVAKINAFNPSPCAWIKYKNHRYKIWKAKSVKKKGRIGEVLDSNLLIGCGKDSVQILEIQKEGKSKMLTDAFVRGNKFEIGSNLE